MMQADRPPENYLWNVLKSGQSYRNIAYLLLTFPLGICYFVTLITGVSVGGGLAVVGIGLFILWGLFGLSGVFANFERWLSNQLLGTRLQGEEGQLFQIRNRNNWRAVGYLALKFPAGILTFVLTVFVTSVIMGMITMPLFYSQETTILVAREIDTLWEAVVASAFGLVLAPFALILLAKFALLWRNLNMKLLNTGVQSPQKQKQKNVSREEIEQDILNRLIDEGMVKEEFLVEEKRKKMSYGE